MGYALVSDIRNEKIWGENKATWVMGELRLRMRGD